MMAARQPTGTMRVDLRVPTQSIRSAKSGNLSFVARAGRAAQGDNPHAASGRKHSGDALLGLAPETTAKGDGTDQPRALPVTGTGPVMLVRIQRVPQGRAGMKKARASGATRRIWRRSTVASRSQELGGFSLGKPFALECGSDLFLPNQHNKKAVVRAAAARDPEAQLLGYPGARRSLEAVSSRLGALGATTKDHQ